MVYYFFLIDSNNPCQSWPIFDAHSSGFRECIDEISRYLISVEGFDVQHPLRLRLLSHLECFTERGISLSSSSHQSWPVLHRQTPSAFATPPLSSFSFRTIDSSFTNLKQDLSSKFIIPDETRLILA